MSVTAIRATVPRLPRTVRRLAVAALVLGFVALLVFGIATLGLSLAEPVPAPRNPFGTGLREAAPAAGGIGAAILALQSQFYRLLTGALAAIRRDGTGFWTLLAIGFAYGVFHAAGPGHGKGVISGYIVASRRTLARGLALSFAAALLQAGIAVALVAVLSWLLRGTAASINAAANAIELGSFALVAAVGAAVLWRRTARLVPADGAAHAHAPGEDCTCGPDGHMPSAEAVGRAAGWREAAGIVLAAGLRPCSGAIILLVFAASQGLVAAGIAATFAMALGTALTTGAFATLAVFAKTVALRLASRRSPVAALVPWLEVAAAALVTVLGLALLLGSAAGSAAG